MRLIKFLNILKGCKRRINTKIPKEINENERIVRTIFSPINLSKDKTKVLPNLFKSPSGIDEVSVTRLNFTTADFCKNHAKNHENSSNDRNYFGFAVLFSKEIIDSNANVISSEKEDNIFHADIKIGYVPIPGKPLPAEFQEKVRMMTEKARKYYDPNINSNKWEGSELN